MATLVVIASHYEIPEFPGGLIFVDIFFVLSGFLITGLLIKEREATGKMRLSRFWFRRVLRIAPVHVLYAAVLTAGYLSGSFSYFKSFRGNTWSVGSYFGAIWLYFANYTTPNTLLFQKVPLTLHLWSLAVEEQFYIVWPLLFLLITRNRFRWVIWCMGLFHVVALMRCTFFVHAAFYLPTRGISFWAGCATALCLSWSPAFRAVIQSKRVGPACGILALALPLLLTNSMTPLHFFQYLLPVTLVPLSVFCAYLWTTGDKTVAGRILSFGPLVYLGKVSYGLYVWHELVRGLVRCFVPHEHTYLVALVAFALSVGLGTISFRYYETPFLRLKRFFY